MPGGTSRTSQSTTWHVISHSMAILKARTTPLIIINTNRYNVWVRQALSAAKLYHVGCDEIEYMATTYQQLPSYIEIPAPPGTQNLSNFQLITLPELHKIILSTPNKELWAQPNPDQIIKTDPSFNSGSNSWDYQYFIQGWNCSRVL